MQIVRLGRSGLKVSQICLGTMMLGLQTGRAESLAVLDTAAELGVDFLDVADSYPGGGTLETVGRTETIVGDWLGGRRDRFVLATKTFNPMGPLPNQTGNSRKHIIAACEASLRRLKTDYIDLYYIHRWDDQTPIDETLEAFDDLRKVGKIRYAGCSNVKAWQLMQSLWTADARNTLRFDAVQSHLSPNRSGTVARGSGERRGGRCVQPASRRAPNGKIQSRRSTARRHSLHARESRRTLCGAILARRTTRRRGAARRRHRIARQIDHARRAALAARPARRHVRHHRSSRAEQLRESLRGLATVLDDADAKACDAAWYAVPRRRPEDER